MTAYAYSGHCLITGGHVASIVAACTSALRGAKTWLVPPNPWLGGEVANGLINWDTGAHEVFHLGDFVRKDYMVRVQRKLGTQRMFMRAPPHVHAQVCKEMLAEYGVHVMYGLRPKTAYKTGAHIDSVDFVNADESDTVTFTCNEWGNGSTDADFGRTCGITFRLGREGFAETGESLAGALVNPSPIVTLRTRYIGSGALLPNLRIMPVGLLPGDADDNVMCLGFRLTATYRTGDQYALRFPKPEGLDYDDPAFYLNMPSYENASRLIPSLGALGFLDLNSDGPAHLAREWATATWDRRIGANYGQTATGSIRQECIEYQVGQYYALANHPDVSEAERDKWAGIGFVKYEYRDGRGIPMEPYIREGHRLENDTILDRNETFAKTGGLIVNDSIGAESYPEDDHSAVWWEVTPGQYIVDSATRGLTGAQRKVVPHQAPFKAHVPRPTEATNFLEIGQCRSQTHAKLLSDRMVPPTMSMGEACGWMMAEKALHGGDYSDNTWVQLRRTELFNAGHVNNPYPFHATP